MKEFLIGFFIIIFCLLMVFIWCACKICSEARKIDEENQDGENL